MNNVIRLLVPTVLVLAIVLLLHIMNHPNEISVYCTQEKAQAEVVCETRP